MQNTTNIKFIKLSPSAKTPSYGSTLAAGADLYSSQDKVVIAPHETVFIGTGLAMAIPEGLAGFIFARSGLACKRSLAPANKVGVIDSDYRGEVKVALHNHSEKVQIIEPGERIAQIVFLPVYFASFEEALSLDDTERGEGGFGSTGTV